MDEATATDRATAPGGFGHALTRARSRAARVLRLEAGWPMLLPALCALAGFAILALLALPQKLPDWLQVALVLLLAGFAAQRIWRGLRHAAPVSAAAVDRRIERRSALRHRPLQTLADHPAEAGDPLQDAIWQAHRARALASLRRLRSGPPRLGLRQHRSGRLGMLLLPGLLLAGIVAGPAAPERLASGFLPVLFRLPGPAPWMQAWITPPDYARLAPLFLTDPHGAVTMPSGSVLQVSLTGLRAPPDLVMHGLDGADGAGPAPAAPRFSRLSDGSWSLTGTLDGSVRLLLRGNGRALADWSIRITPLPTAVLAWDGAPGAAREPWRTRLPWRVDDPYGLDTLVAEIRLADPEAAAAPVLRVPIAVAPATRLAHGAALPDLSADPRAGEAVTARLVATDGSGRTTQSPEARFTLPARPFRNPLARAVLDTRKRLALGRETRDAAAADLDALGQAPGQFASDSGMFLNLSSITTLLHQDDVADAAAIDEAVDRMWELALALEDGLHNDRPGARAAAEVRAANEAVSAQLERMRQLGDKGQTDREQAELERRIQALSAAIGRRMQALAEQARRDHGTLPPMPDTNTLSGEDLSRMMRQMRDDAAHGRAGDAMQRLAQMQSMLDRMRAATPQDLQSAQQQAEAQRQVREQMAGLQDLVRRQSTLLDQSQSRHAVAEKQSRQASGAELDPQAAELLRRLGIPQTDEEGAPAETPSGDGGGDPPENLESQQHAPPLSPDQLAQRQAAEQGRQAQRETDARVQRSLSRALEELGEEFKALAGAQPGGFEEARRAMGSARAALAAGHDQTAEDAQQQALAALQKGAGQMQQALASGQGGAAVLLPGMTGESGGDGSDPGQEEAGDDRPGPRDPLGRPVAGGLRADDGDTHVPDKAEAMRAREIEQELRRRDTDRTRAPDELNYLDRLLKPF